MPGIDVSNIVMAMAFFVPVISVLTLMGAEANSSEQMKHWRTGMIACIAAFLASIAVLIVTNGVLRHWVWVMLMEITGISITGMVTAMGILSRAKEEKQTDQRQIMGFLSIILIIFWLFFTFTILFSGGDEKEGVWKDRKVVMVNEGWSYTYHAYVDAWTLGPELGRSPGPWEEKG